MGGGLDTGKSIERNRSILGTVASMIGVLGAGRSGAFFMDRVPKSIDVEKKTATSPQTAPQVTQPCTPTGQ